jgi:hypothetical protein
VIARAYFYFLKNKESRIKIEVGLGDHHAVCVSMYPTYKFQNAWTNLYETWYVAPEPIWTAYFINPSHQSVDLSVYPPIVARKRLEKTFPRQLRNAGCVVFSAVRVVSKESRGSVLPRTSCLIAIFLIPSKRLATSKLRSRFYCLTDLSVNSEVLPYGLSRFSLVAHMHVILWTRDTDL